MQAECGEWRREPGMIQAIVPGLFRSGLRFLRGQEDLDRLFHAAER